MITLLVDQTLPHLDQLFTRPFVITPYQTEHELLNHLTTHDVLICRSTLRVDEALLKDSTIRCVATASSGIDHIDVDYLTSRNIALFHAKGCNAHAVADYVMTNVAWLLTQGHALGKRAGVIGLGEVGKRVAARLTAIGLDVSRYDPWPTDVGSGPFSDILSCDIIFIHANLHQMLPYPSAGLFNAAALSALKPNTIIINAARGGIVDEYALLHNPSPLIYCTDVYAHEPDISAHIIAYATLCTPHIAGHSVEAKCNAVYSIAQQIYDYYDVDSHTPSLPHYAIHQPIPTHWCEQILKQYNPIHDTLALKQASDKKAAFLSLRKAHARHDFHWSTDEVR